MTRNRPFRVNLLRISILVICVALLFSGCAKSARTAKSRAAPVQKTQLQPEFRLVTAEAHDTAATIAARILGDPAKHWLVEDFNNRKTFSAGQEVIVPLRHPNPAGIYATGYQTIPILCYHRLGAEKSRMTITPEDFARQMDYLAQHDYRVIRIADLAAFLQGEEPLPKRSVVITFDDGYKSVFQNAYPVLLQHQFPATIFVYSDFIGARDALTWNDMQEMTASGLIDIQPHSKSHANLGITQPDEDNLTYQTRLYTETRVPSWEIAKHLKRPSHTFAFPYGDTNKNVSEILKRDGYRLAVTVQPGTNAAFSNPYMLQRSMVFGDLDLDGFARLLETFTPVPLTTPTAQPAPDFNASSTLGHEKLVLRLTEQGRHLEALVQWKLLRLLNPQNKLYEDLLQRTEDRIAALVAQHLSAAQAAEDRGNLGGARRELLSALALDPRNHDAMDFMRRLEADRVWRVQAAKLEKLREVEERKSIVAEQEGEYLELGVSLSQRGDYAGAIREIQKYLNTYPNDPQARALLNEAMRKAAARPRNAEVQE